MVIITLHLDSTLGMQLCINEYNQAWRAQSVPMKNDDESWDILRNVFTNIKQKTKSEKA